MILVRGFGGCHGGIKGVLGGKPRRSWAPTWAYLYFRGGVGIPEACGRVICCMPFSKAPILKPSGACDPRAEGRLAPEVGSTVDGAYILYNI